MTRMRAGIVFLLLLLALLAGCDYEFVRTVPPATAGPTSPPGSPCAAVSRESLQSWLNEKLPRQEKEVLGGVVYLDSPRVSNCMGNRLDFQVLIGYQRPNVLIELGVTEGHIDLRYDPGAGEVCVDLFSLLGSANLEPQGVEQAGQEIKVAEVKAGINDSLQEMPAQVRQKLDEAADSVSIQGGDPNVQGIGTDAAGPLLDWAVGELLDRLNGALARLVGGCMGPQ